MDLAVGLEHWTVSWEALVVPVGVGRLDNTKNVREKLNRSILDRPIEIGFMNDKRTRMIVYTLTSG